ncbi:MAG: MATE family efflux transporter [Oscillospiraceae bacterium]|nr:MATE family efflux transporter [Oscillospiraceae bacterium]
MSEVKRKTLINDFTTGPVTPQLIKFATPLFFSGLLQTVYNMVDMIVVGQYVGSGGLSAVALGGEVMMMLTFVAMGMSNAGQVLISQLIGAGRRDDLKRMIGTLFTFLACCALTVSMVCLMLRFQILGILNTPVEAWDSAVDYVTVCIFGLIFIYGYNLVSAIMRGMGDSKRPFIFIAIASVTNLVLDMLFIAVFDMGTMGAALATVIGQAISFIFAITYLYNHKEQFGFDFKPSSFRIHGDMLSSLIKLGIPMVLQSAAITFSKLFITSWINSYGVVMSALTGIGNKLQSVTNVFAQAFTTSGASMVAQNIGAEKYERVPKIIKTLFVVDGIITAVLVTAIVLFPQQIFGIFTNDEAVLSLVGMYLPVAVLQFCSCVLRPPMSALINGSGNPKLNFAIAILDGLMMRIGLAYVLGIPMGFGIHGFWYGNALASFMPFVIGMPYFLSGGWKKNRLVFK